MIDRLVIKSNGKNERLMIRIHWDITGVEAVTGYARRVSQL